jgi:uncharacterized membrane protein
MSDVPVQVVISAFQDEQGAKQALDELKQAKWAGLIGIQDAAVLRMDQKGKLHIKETGDWGGGKGAVVGGVIGGVVGLLAGPVGWLGLTGAVIGGLAAKLSDTGFSDDRLKELGAALQPGTSAIVAVIEHKWVAQLEKAMEEAGADVLTEEISADIAAQLEAGREVAYSALSTQDGLTTGRVAVGDDEIQVSGMTLTAEGFVAGEAVATEEGVIAHRVIGTDEGVVEAVAVAGPEEEAKAIEGEIVEAEEEAEDEPAE